MHKKILGAAALVAILAATAIGFFWPIAPDSRAAFCTALAGGIIL